MYVCMYQSKDDEIWFLLFLPGSEGRAGMAAIVDENNSIDMEYLSEAFTRSLPTYARPLFVRFIKEADTTGEQTCFRIVR